MKKINNMDKDTLFEFQLMMKPLAEKGLYKNVQKCGTLFTKRSPCGAIKPKGQYISIFGYQNSNKVYSISLMRCKHRDCPRCGSSVRYPIQRWIQYWLEKAQKQKWELAFHTFTQKQFSIKSGFIQIKKVQGKFIKSIRAYRSKYPEVAIFTRIEISEGGNVHLHALTSTRQGNSEFLFKRLLKIWKKNLRITSDNAQDSYILNNDNNIMIKARYIHKVAPYKELTQDQREEWYTITFRKRLYRHAGIEQYCEDMPAIESKAPDWNFEDIPSLLIWYLLPNEKQILFDFIREHLLNGISQDEFQRFQSICIEHDKNQKCTKCVERLKKLIQEVSK